MLRTLSASLLLLLGSFALVLAQDAPEKLPADLVKLLDAESFADRQAAGEALTKLGKAAIPALAEGTKSESAEIVTRSLDILRKHFVGSDAALKAAAKEALEKLAANEGAVARRAVEVLKPTSASPSTSAGQPRAAPALPGGFGGGGLGGIRWAIGAADGATKRVTMRDVNGVKEIEVVEGDRTIKINDDPAKGIKVKVTEKKDGKEETKEYEAKNAAELKEKHPEAHKLYEQHKGEVVEVRVGPFPALPPGFPPVPLPVGPAIVRPAIIPDSKDASDRLDKARQELGEAAEKLKKLAEGSPQAAEIKAAIEAIERSKKELEAVRAKLP